MSASKLERTDFVIRDKEGLVVAWAWFETRTGEGGVNTIDILLDPTHNPLAQFVIQHLLYKTVMESPGHRVEIVVPAWMEGVTNAVEQVGFTRRLGGLRKGLIF